MRIPHELFLWQVYLHIALVREVVDYGCISGVTVNSTDITKRTLSISLSHEIELDENYAIIWWDTDGSVETLTPTSIQQQDKNISWLTDVPQHLNQPLVIAVAYRGFRLGTWWDISWTRLLATPRIHNPYLTATLLRWFHLPLLSQRFLNDVQSFVDYYPADALASWLDDKNFKRFNCSVEDSDSWFSTMRIIFQNWEPKREHVSLLISKLAGDTDDVPLDEYEQLRRVAERLMRVSPLLMGKVIYQWAKGIGTPQWGVHSVQILIRVLYYAIADADSDASLNRKTVELQEEIARVMNADMNFIKALTAQALELFQGQSVSSINQNNISVAMNVEPFRIFIAIRTLELIEQMIRGNK